MGLIAFQTETEKTSSNERLGQTHTFKKQETLHFVPFLPTHKFDSNGDSQCD